MGLEDLTAVTVKRIILNLNTENSYENRIYLEQVVK
jgi:hypothetical protein